MRTLAPAAAAVLAGPVVPLALLLQMLTTPAVRLCTASVALTVGADTYLGQGSLGGVESVVETAGAGGGLRFSLSGVPSDLVALALAEDTRSKASSLRLAILDPTTQAVLDTPLVWSGTLDQMVINHGAVTSNIGVTAEHRSATYRRAKPLRYTDGDQQLLYAGDTSNRYVVSQSQARDVWPAAGYWRQ